MACAGAAPSRISAKSFPSSSGMPITLKYPGVTVLETARSCPASVRTRPCTVKDRIGIPCAQVVGSQQNAFRPESRICLACRAKTLEEERRRDQNDHGQSDFRAHQNFARTAAEGRVGTGAKPVLWIQPCQMDRRRRAENQTARSTEQYREGQGEFIHSCLKPDRKCANHGRSEE